MKCGILLSSADPSQLERFEHQAHALLDKGHALYAYLLHSGVRHFCHPLMKGLTRRGLHLHVCSLAAEKNKVAVSDEAVFCGLGTLASLILHTETFFNFAHHSPETQQPGPHHRVLLTTTGSPDNGLIAVLETLRVAAGLAQLSTLSINLQIQGNALTILQANPQHPEWLTEACHDLHLLHEAGGTLFLPQATTLAPIPYQLTSPRTQQTLLLNIG
jgi:hypothetical protein